MAIIYSVAKMQRVFQQYQLHAIRDIIYLLWGRTGSGVPSGLQNQHEGLTASQVGSIPTLSRHTKEAPITIVIGAFCIVRLFF